MADVHHGAEYGINKTSTRETRPLQARDSDGAALSAAAAPSPVSPREPGRPKADSTDCVASIGLCTPGSPTRRAPCASEGTASTPPSSLFESDDSDLYEGGSVGEERGGHRAEGGEERTGIEQAATHGAHARGHASPSRQPGAQVNGLHGLPSSASAGRLQPLPHAEVEAQTLKAWAVPEADGAREADADSGEHTESESDGSSAPQAVSALLAAVHAGDDQRIVRLLRAHVTEQPDARTVHLRLAMGEQPPKPRPSPLLAWRDRHGRTALHHAVRALQYSAAQLILEAGADVNAVDGDGRRPVHDAPSGSALQNLLVYYGADLQVQDRWGRMPEWSARVRPPPPPPPPPPSSVTATEVDVGTATKRGSIHGEAAWQGEPIGLSGGFSGSQLMQRRLQRHCEARDAAAAAAAAAVLAAAKEGARRVASGECVGVDADASVASSFRTHTPGATGVARSCTAPPPALGVRDRDAAIDGTGGSSPLVLAGEHSRRAEAEEGPLPVTRPSQSPHPPAAPLTRTNSGDRPVVAAEGVRDALDAAMAEAAARGTHASDGGMPANAALPHRAHRSMPVRRASTEHQTLRRVLAQAAVRGLEMEGARVAVPGAEAATPAAGEGADGPSGAEGAAGKDSGLVLADSAASRAVGTPPCVVRGGIVVSQRVVAAGSQARRRRRSSLDPAATAVAAARLGGGGGGGGGVTGVDCKGTQPGSETASPPQAASSASGLASGPLSPGSPAVGASGVGKQLGDESKRPSSSTAKSPALAFIQRTGTWLLRRHSTPGKRK